MQILFMYTKESGYEWVLTSMLCMLGRYKNKACKIMLNTPGVNFINVLRARFLYESAFL